MDGPTTPQRFPEDHAPQYLLHDRDAAFTDVVSTIAAMQIHEVVTAPRSPWQKRAASPLRPRGGVATVHGPVASALLRQLTDRFAAFSQVDTDRQWQCSVLGRSLRLHDCPSQPVINAIASVLSTPDRLLGRDRLTSEAWIAAGRNVGADAATRTVRGASGSIQRAPCVPARANCTQIGLDHAIAIRPLTCPRCRRRT